MDLHSNAVDRQIFVISQFFTPENRTGLLSNNLRRNKLLLDNYDFGDAQPTLRHLLHVEIRGKSSHILNRQLIGTTGVVIKRKQRKYNTKP